MIIIKIACDMSNITEIIECNSVSFAKIENERVESFLRCYPIAMADEPDCLDHVCMETLHTDVKFKIMHDQATRGLYQ